MSTPEPMPAAYYALTATEAEFMSAVVDLATLTGWTTYHTYDSRRSNHGFPDLVLVRPPKLVFAELKREKGKPTKPQDAWLALLSRIPGVGAFLWRPSDWPEIEKVLAR